jgi:nicotinamidase-related amidase
MKTIPSLPLLLSLLTAPALPAATAPATLLEIAGVKWTPGRLATSVVLIIDAQREYDEGRLRLSGINAALGDTQRLLQRARAAGTPVIHIQQLSPASRGIFVEGTAMAGFTAASTPVAGEIVITKKLPNAFAGTNLADVLHQLGRREIIISGYMTHMCVSATARASIDLGFHPTIVANACATRDLRDSQGDTIPAATVHRVALAELADRFATVVNSLDEIPD